MKKATAIAAIAGLGLGGWSRLLTTHGRHQHTTAN